MTPYMGRNNTVLTTEFTPNNPTM